MLIEMFRFQPNRRQPYRIFIFGAGESLRLDLMKPVEVEDKLGYQILAEHSSFVREVKKKAKPIKPKAPAATVKEMPEEKITTS